MNTYQVVTSDETIPPILSSDSHRGGGIAIMQTTTGTLTPGAHAGSYNGQDAYNDMLIVNNGILNSKDRRIQGISAEPYDSRERLQERNRSDYRGGADNE